MKLKFWRHPCSHSHSSSNAIQKRFLSASNEWLKSKPSNSNSNSYYYNRSHQSGNNYYSHYNAVTDPSTAAASASTTAASKILQFGNEDFLARIHSDHLRFSEPSIRYQTFPRLARLIRSFRPGELTVFTGPTGSGKTTVLSQLSLDYCFQGVSTLWGSFEIRNTRLARIMMEQVSGISGSGTEDGLAGQDCAVESSSGSSNSSCISGNTSNSISVNSNINNNNNNNNSDSAAVALLHAQSILKQIPMYFMDYFGSVPLDSVLDCMDEAVANHGIQHVILDNLQFMLSGQHSSSLDKFDLTDRSVAALRSFATRRNVHVTLVIHPRKELDDTPLGLASVSGTAKATQEADNVIILQKVGDARYLDVKKNRFDGELGTVRIKFNSQSRLTFEE